MSLTPINRRAAVVVAALGCCGAPLYSFGQQPGPAQAVADPAAEVLKAERLGLPFPEFMAAVEGTLGDKAAQLVRLTPAQAKAVRSADLDFQHQVREFLRLHGRDPAARVAADVTIPDRQEAERRVLDLLRKDQRGALEGRLTAMVEQRLREMQAANPGSSGRPPAITRPGQGPVTQTDSSSDSSSSSDSKSDHSSQSNSQSSSNSSSDRQSNSSSQRNSSSDRQSDRKTDRQSRSDKDSSTKRSSDKNSSSDAARKDDHSKRSGQSWSKLDAQQRKAVLRDLLNQLPAKDRGDVARELGIPIDDRRR